MDFFAAVGFIEAGPILVFFIVALCTIAYTSAPCEGYSFDRKQALVLFLVEVPPLRALVVVLSVYFVYQLHTFAAADGSMTRRLIWNLH